MSYQDECIVDIYTRS